MRSTTLVVCTLLLPWLGGACAPWSGPSPLQVESLRRLAEEVDAQRTWDDVLALVSAHATDTPVDCSTLNPEAYPSLCHLTRDKTRLILQGVMEANGLQVRRHEVLASNLFTSNLIAELPGVSHPEEIVLVGAHYDAYYAGADDNSTGAAALMEAVRVLSRHRFARTIRFVGFDLEEFGLIGSNRYVDTLQGQKIVNVLALDMLGFYSTELNSQGSLPGLPTPQQADFLAVIGNHESVPYVSDVYALQEALGLIKVVTLIAPAQGPTPIGGALMRSDHAPFWLTGQKAVFFTDTANFRNPNYHTPNDTADTLNPTLFAQAVRLTVASVAYWAGGPQ